MAHDQENDPWLNTLAGKTPAHDASTRQAQALRGYFEQQAQHTTALDEAAKRRVMNALAAQGVFASAAPLKSAALKPAQSTSVLARLQSWLFPQGHASGARWSALAAVIMAVAVIPFVALQGPTGDDDPGGIKSFTPPVAAPLVVIDSAQPEQFAAQLVATLERHGISATLRSQGGDHWVQAHIPPERLSAVQAELSNMGLAAAPDGQLSVQFRRQR